MSGVGTKLVFEDDRVIVWHLDLESGQHGALHTHTLNYVVRVVSGSTLEVFGPDNELLYIVELEAGAAVAFTVDGERIVSDRPGYPAVPATHSVKNVGTETFAKSSSNSRYRGFRFPVPDQSRSDEK